LEFSVSVGFIHKEFVTMHGHKILKLQVEFIYSNVPIRLSGRQTQSQVEKCS
jgi:hypothetical protein